MLTLFSLVLITSLLIVPTGAAQAASWPDPVVTSLNGDSDFTATMVDPISLSFGTAVTDKGLVVPSGFPSGEKQFAGKAVTIKGLESGKASLCFSFPTYRYGWRGNVYQWDGTAWSMISSSLTEGIEGGAATVCATISTDGTYAFIIGYGLSQKVSSLPLCAEDFEVELLAVPLETEDFLALSMIGLFTYPSFGEGSEFSYSIFNVTPAGSLSGALSQRGTTYIETSEMGLVLFLDPEILSGISSPLDFPESTYLYFDPASMEEDLDFTVRVTTPTCYKDFPYSPDLFYMIPFGGY